MDKIAGHHAWIQDHIVRQTQKHSSSLCLTKHWGATHYTSRETSANSTRVGNLRKNSGCANHKVGSAQQGLLPEITAADATLTVETGS